MNNFNTSRRNRWNWICSIACLVLVVLAVALTFGPKFAMARNQGISGGQVGNYVRSYLDNESMGIWMLFSYVLGWLSRMSTSLQGAVLFWLPYLFLLVMPLIYAQLNWERDGSRRWCWPLLICCGAAAFQGLALLPALAQRPLHDLSLSCSVLFLLEAMLLALLVIGIKEEKPALMRGCGIAAVALALLSPICSALVGEMLVRGGASVSLRMLQAILRRGLIYSACGSVWPLFKCCTLAMYALIAFREASLPTLEPKEETPEPDAEEPTIATSVRDITDALEKLGLLYEAGILTEQEFARKKEELLRRL